MPIDESATRLRDQIARLQERQRELIHENETELEQLRLALDEQLSNQHQPLVQEVEHLRTQVQRLEQERAQQEQHLQELARKSSLYQERAREAVQLLRDSLTGFADLDTLPAPTPPVNASQPLSVAPPAVSKAAPIQAVKSPEKNVPKARALTKIRSIRHKLIAKRLITFAFIGAICYGGVKGIAVFHIFPSNTGQVAGVSTDSSITNPSSTVSKEVGDFASQDYKESFSDVSFENTQWEPSDDSDFGISIQYPANASNRVHTPGGSNLWFLRKDGYILKITKEDTNITLDQWMDSNKDNYTTDYTLSKGTFKNQPAWVGKAITEDSTSGTYYFVKHSNTMYTFWAKDEDPNTDDGKRLSHMINSIQFTN